MKNIKITVISLIIYLIYLYLQNHMSLWENVLSTLLVISYLFDKTSSFLYIVQHN